MSSRWAKTWPGNAALFRARSEKENRNRNLVSAFGKGGEGEELFVAFGGGGKIRTKCSFLLYSSSFYKFQKLDRNLPNDSKF